MFAANVLLTSDCESQTVTECSLRNVTSLCLEPRARRLCDQRPGCELFSCRSVPVTSCSDKRSQKCLNVPSQVRIIMITCLMVTTDQVCTRRCQQTRCRLQTRQRCRSVPSKKCVDIRKR